MIYLDNAATTRMYDEVIDVEKEEVERISLPTHLPCIPLVWKRKFNKKK